MPEIVYLDHTGGRGEAMKTKIFRAIRHAALKIEETMINRSTSKFSGDLTIQLIFADGGIRAAYVIESKKQPLI